MIPRLVTDDTGGRVVVVDERTGVFGSGRDVSTATADFWLAVEGHTAVLAAERHLSAGLKEQLRVLREYR